MIYLPGALAVLIAALSDPRTAVKMEGINYSDTLLFAGVVLALASDVSSLSHGKKEEGGPQEETGGRVDRSITG